MTYAIIDIGSNTIRLTVNLVNGTTAQNLFHKKHMAGLAGYVKKGELTEEGISRVCESLLDFQALLSHLNIDETTVFATASLRNISNTVHALSTITRQTGYVVELISGEEEALLGYYGIRQEVSPEDGILLDIGGGSTEITAFQGEQVSQAVSVPAGSLNLYARLVKSPHVVPTKKEILAIQEDLSQTFRPVLASYPKSSHFYGIGGSMRAAIKVARRVLDLPPDCRTLTAAQCDTMKHFLTENRREVTSGILRFCPDRIHTLVPGFLIFDTIFRELGGESLTVCQYGVREGYLWDRYMRNEK
jgi:exopolyphosphatase/guanosine-5'-triphosphate,3'-diphosphate pyrophosphatase